MCALTSVQSVWVLGVGHHALQAQALLGGGIGKLRARGVGPRNLQTSQREGRSQPATTGESLLRADARPAFVGVCDLRAGPRGSQVRLLRA